MLVNLAECKTKTAYKRRAREILVLANTFTIHEHFLNKVRQNWLEVTRLVFPAATVKPFPVPSMSPPTLLSSLLLPSFFRRGLLLLVGGTVLSLSEPLL